MKFIFKIFCMSLPKYHDMITAAYAAAVYTCTLCLRLHTKLTVTAILLNIS